MIYKYLYRNPEPYLAVIKLLVAKPSGMTREEIREQLGGSNNGHLGDLLTDLVYCDFLRQYKGEKSEDQFVHLQAGGLLYIILPLIHRQGFHEYKLLDTPARHAHSEHMARIGV